MHTRNISSTKIILFSALASLALTAAKLAGLLLTSISLALSGLIGLLRQPAAAVTTQ